MATNINETLEDLIAAVSALAGQSEACCEVGGQQIDDPPSDGSFSVGEGEQFPDYETYFNAKCNVSNGIFDTIVGTVEWLRDNNVDLKAGLMGSVTTAIIMGLALSGPVGWAIQLSGVVITVLAGFIIKSVLDFNDLLDGLDSVHEELVQALYSATNPDIAETNFLAMLDTGTPSPSVPERTLVAWMLNGTMLNQLFTPRDDVALYNSPDGIDCAGSPSYIWNFATGFEGWTFADESTGSSSATRTYDALYKGIKQTTIVADVEDERGKGHHTSPTVAIPVLGGNHVEFHYSATSDGEEISIDTKVTFTNENTYTDWGHGAGPGWEVLDLPAAGTIAKVEVWLSRGEAETEGADDFTVLLTEVRVVG